MRHNVRYVKRLSAVFWRFSAVFLQFVAILIGGGGVCQPYKILGTLSPTPKGKTAKHQKGKKLQQKS
jgi:hypothetical protein